MTTTSGPTSRGVLRALWWGLPIVLCAVFLWRIGTLDPADRYNDDFFYYVIPAQHWVDGHGSTFFPRESTNGYHPLWFLWIAALYLCAGGGWVFFALVDLSLLILLIGFYLLFTRFLRRLTGDDLAALVGSAAATVGLAVIAKSAVEAALAAFCVAVLLVYLTRKPLASFGFGESAVAGLLAAVLVLARLDAALLVVVLAVVVLRRWPWRQVVAALVGAAPLYAYLALNVVAFGHVSTTSAAAKSLAVYVPPDLYFLGQPWPVVEIPVIVVAVVMAVLVRRAAELDVGWMALALAIAPLLQLIVQAFLSGWALFPWYFYLFIMAVGATGSLIVTGVRRRRVSSWVGLAVGAVTLLVPAAMLFVGVMTADPWQVQIAAIARRLQTFTAAHPGVYAMGDAAGTTAWLTRQPIVHLEGLMMSHAFTDRIRQRQQLEQVFRDYHVNYYVAVRDDGHDPGGCPQFAEPNPLQASPRAPAMRQTICVAPVQVFSPGGRYDAVRVYRIDPTTGRAF